MSELSTVAIKDGHRGHPHHHSHNSQHLSTGQSGSLDAERADRISRLAGLERVGTVRPTSNSSLPVSAAAAHQQGYFDNHGQSRYKEISTVGSASATGSVGGRTTWASGSDMYDNGDKMSEDQDMMDTSSTGGFSDEGNASLVGFGEGAGSTVSGPISSGSNLRANQRQSSRGGTVPSYIRDTPTPVSPSGGGRDTRMSDGIAYEQDGQSFAAPQHQRNSPGGAEVAAQTMQGIDVGSGGGMMVDDKGLGTFPFEQHK